MSISIPATVTQFGTGEVRIVTVFVTPLDTGGLVITFEDDFALNPADRLEIHLEQIPVD